MADWWEKDAAVGGTATEGNWWEKDQSASAEFDAIYQEIGARVDPADYGPMKDVLTQDEFGNVQADPAQYEQLAPEQRRAVNEVTVAANQGAGSLQQGYEKFFLDAADPESPDNFMYGKVKDQASTRASYQAIAGLGQQIKETYERYTGDGEEANQTNRAGQAMRGSLDELAGGSGMERNVRGATESTLKALYAGRAGGLKGIIAWATQGAYNDAKAQAVDSGMTESEATKYAIGQGAIEGGVTALFQMMGFGGTEKLLSGSAKWQGVKAFVAGLFGEAAEEQTIAFAQMALEKLGDVDKTDLTPEQALQVASDTMVQTALGFGMAQGISTATQFVENPSRRTAKAAGVDQFAKTAKERRDLVKAVKSQITTLSVTTNTPESRQKPPTPGKPEEVNPTVVDVPRPRTPQTEDATPRFVNRETRGKGTQYHGTSATKLSPTNDHYSTLNYYGQGFYTTDAVDVAYGYSKRGSKRSGKRGVWRIEEKRPLNIYDAEQPISPEIRAILDDIAESQEILKDSIDQNPANLRELYDDFRDHSRDNGLSADTVQETFDTIAYRLQQMGYEGISHKGGLRTGAKEHTVKIYFNPEEDIAVSELVDDPLMPLPSAEEVRKSIIPDQPTGLAILPVAKKPSSQESPSVKTEGVWINTAPSAPRPGPTTPEGPVQMAAGIPISKATARWFKQNFTSGGEANKPILDAAFRRDGRIRGHVKKASQNSVDLQKAVRKEFKIPFRQQIPDTISTQLNEALRDPAVMATLPQSVAVPLTQMRDHIDGISQVVASLPGISADLQLTIQQNLGKYVTRTYKKFGQNPQAWMDKALADPQIMTDFAAEVRTTSPNATDDEIYQLAQILLQRNTASLGDIGFPAGAATKKYTDVLKKRKDLSPAIRQLYGERTDAFENYAETIGKLASLTAHRQFADEVLQTGLQQGFISPVDAPAPGHTKEVNHQQIRQLAPLAGHVMPVELADALNTAYTVSKPGWSARQLLKLSGAAKASATVLSWQATIRNLTGNVPIALANGAFDPADFARSAKTIWWQDMLNKGDAAAKAEIADLNRLGLMEDTSVSELNSMAKDVSDSVQDYIAGINPTDHWKRATRGVGRFYQSMDSVWKVHTFYNYLPKYAAANPQMTEPELREHVAKIVREITPTYSEASKAAKFASRYFPLGPFAMFSAEMWRTTANRVRLSIEEIKSGNPALAKIGYQRMAGQAVALGGMTALAMTIKAALGVSDDDEEAIRQRVAPWQRNAILIPQSVDKKTGKVEFFDASYNDPFSIFSEPAMALWRGEPEEATGALAEPFVSEDIAYGVIVSLLRGTDENNRPIYDPGLSPAEQNMQITKYVAGKFMPGTLRSAERIRKGLMEETSPSGRQYEAGNEALSAIAGVKLDTMDRSQSDYYRNREFNSRVQDSGSAVRRAFLQRGTVDLGTLEKTYKSADAARRKAMKEWRLYVDGSIQLGEQNPYAKVVSDVGAESEIVKSMYTGKYVPYQFRPQDLRKMLALPGGQERVDLWLRLNAEAQQPSESTVGSE